MTAFDQARQGHELYEQLAVGHALSALEPEDEQVFLAHLPSCAPCARSLVEHAETLSHLAYGTAAAEPPPSLLEGIRAGVAESGRAGAFPAPVSLDAARVRRAEKTVRRTTALVGVAAAIVMVTSLVFVNHGLKSQEHVAKLNAANVTQAVSALLVSGAHSVNLHGAKGTAVAVVNGDRVSLVMAGLPVNDAQNSIYVLWEKSSFGDVRAIGTFDVRSADVAVVNGLHLDKGSALKSFIVTREVGRSAPALTTQPAVVSGEA